MRVGFCVAIEDLFVKYFDKLNTYLYKIPVVFCLAIAPAHSSAEILVDLYGGGPLSNGSSNSFVIDKKTGVGDLSSSFSEYGLRVQFQSGGDWKVAYGLFLENFAYSFSEGIDEVEYKGLRFGPSVGTFRSWSYLSDLSFVFRTNLDLVGVFGGDISGAAYSAEARGYGGRFSVFITPFHPSSNVKYFHKFIGYISFGLSYSILSIDVDEATGSATSTDFGDTDKIFSFIISLPFVFD